MTLLLTPTCPPEGERMVLFMHDAGHAGRRLNRGRGAGTVTRTVRVGVTRGENGTHRGIQCAVVGRAHDVGAGIEAGGVNAGVGGGLGERENFRITRTAGDGGNDGLHNCRIGDAVQVRHTDANRAAGGITVGGRTIVAAGEFRGARRAEVEERGGDAGGFRGGDTFRAFIRGNGDVVIARCRSRDPLIFVSLGKIVAGHDVARQSKCWSGWSRDSAR